MADRTNFIEAHEILMLVEKTGGSVNIVTMRGPFKKASDAFAALTGSENELSFARVNFFAVASNDVAEGEDVSEDIAWEWLNDREPNPENDTVPAYVKDTEAFEDYAEQWHIDSGFDPVREYGTYNATAL